MRHPLHAAAYADVRTGSELYTRLAAISARIASPPAGVTLYAQSSASISAGHTPTHPGQKSSQANVPAFSPRNTNLPTAQQATATPGVSCEVHVGGARLATRVSRQTQQPTRDGSVMHFPPEINDCKSLQATLNDRFKTFKARKKDEAKLRQIYIAMVTRLSAAMPRSEDLLASRADEFIAAAKLATDEETIDFYRLCFLETMVKWIKKPPSGAMEVMPHNVGILAHVVSSLQGGSIDFDSALVAHLATMPCGAIYLHNLTNTITSYEEGPWIKQNEILQEIQLVGRVLFSYMNSKLPKDAKWFDIAYRWLDEACTPTVMHPCLTPAAVLEFFKVLGETLKADDAHRFREAVGRVQGSLRTCIAEARELISDCDHDGNKVIPKISPEKLGGEGLLDDLEKAVS